MACLTLNLVGCEVPGENQEPDICYETQLWEPTERYSAPRSNLSCDEFLERHEYPEYNCSVSMAAEVDEPMNDSEEVTIENYLIPGVVEGTQIAFNETHKISIEDGYLVLKDIDGSHKKYLSSNNPQKIISYNNKFLVITNNKINLVNSSGKTEKTTSFTGEIEVFLRDHTLFVFERRRELDQSVNCKKIQYFSDAKYLGLTISHTIDLPLFELKTNDDIFYGSWNAHVDQENQYLISTHHDGATLVSIGKDYKYNIMDKNIPSKNYIRSYDDEIHIIQTDPVERGAIYSIYDQDLAEIDSLEVVAPGETLSAVHFTPSKVYFSTFLQTDPLYALDPVKREYLSELSFPGRPLYLSEINSEYIISLNRASSYKSYLNLISTSGDLEIVDVLDLDEGFWNFVYSDYLQKNNYIFLKGYQASYLLKADNSELDLIVKLEGVSNFYFKGASLFIYKDSTWEEILLD